MQQQDDARVRDSSTSVGMTKKLFRSLVVYEDVVPRSAAMNMAIDEALLEIACAPTIRFYRWDHDALSFGYFGRFSDVARFEGERELVRRWTGGGIVFHGEDLTYSITIPSSEPAFAGSTMSIYEKVHRGLCEALAGTGHQAIVAAEADRSQVRKRHAAVDGSGSNCFTNPVRADVMLNDRKIAGAAQRRTNCGLLQQGSIQNVDVENGLAERFAQSLSRISESREFNEEILVRAREIAERKYGTNAWLRKR